jgi:aspartate carbamoyltransferase regulatory subunit
MNEYERGVIDGMQKQAKSSVDKAVNTMAQRTWRGLTDKEFEAIIMSAPNATVPVILWQLIQDKLKEKNT